MFVRFDFRFCATGKKKEHNFLTYSERTDIVAILFFYFPVLSLIQGQVQYVPK